MAVDTGGNQCVDYVWGNMAPQPDTDRETPLDDSQGFHLMLTTAYNGFPGYTPVAPYLDMIENVAVPNIVGVLPPQAESALELAGLVLGTNTPTHVGATTSNDLKVKTQSVAADTIVNVGSTVNVGTFLAPTVPDVVGMTEADAEAALIAAHLVKGAVTTADNAAGATAENDGLVKTQTPAAEAKANTGAAVALVKYAYTAE